MTANDVWRLPFYGGIDNAKCNKEVCVVGVFGKSTLGCSSKNSFMRKLVKSKDLPIHNPASKEKLKGDEFRSKDLPKIEVCFDEENNTIYVNLISIHDVTTLCDVASRITKNGMEHSTSHDMMKDFEVQHLFGLVYLCSICHLLVLVHPVSQFDISYDRLFQHVASLRTKLVPVIKDVLKDCSVGRDWWVNGRPCPPRLLLVFQECHISHCATSKIDGDARTPNEVGQAGRRKKTPVKRLQHTIEDQVYRILRSSRVLTNNAVNCLFSVPPNQAFVHIMAEEYEKKSPVAGMFELLTNSLTRHRDPNAMSRAKHLLMNVPNHWKNDYMSGGERKRAEIQDSGSPLRSFISQHTSLAIEKKGFNDSIGRNPLPSHFELPTLKTWLKVANGLYHLFFAETKSLGPDFESPNSANNKKVEEDRKSIEDMFTKVSNCKKNLRSKVDFEVKFSEARCSKVLPMAIAVYQNSLPSHYTSKVHNNQLTQALLTYDQHARGPAAEKYRDQLRSDCMTFWSSGRQLCEVRSLTDRHCIHRYHILAQANGIQDPDSDPPVLFHSSRSRSTATSSCGTVQGMRDDPFDLKEANYDFYVQLDKKAHVQALEVYPFPVFQPGDELQGYSMQMFGDGTASFPSQLLSTENPDYKSISAGLRQSASIATQDDESYNKDGKSGGGGGGRQRLRHVSDVVTESVTEDFDNVISTQGSIDVKDSAEVSSQEVSQGKDGPRSSPRKPLINSPVKDVPDVEAAGNPVKDVKIRASVNLSFALSFEGHSDGSAHFNKSLENDSPRDSVAMDPGRDNLHVQKENIPKEIKPSHFNFIDGMIHSNCKKGVLPLYPSWSLMKVGNYSHYMAIRGLETPGFLPGTNFLVPWDIPVDKPKDLASLWPAPGEAQGKKIPMQREQKQTAAKRNKNDGNTVRAFIGYEYETLRGQRFICSAPDKPVKVTSSGTVKDSFHKLLESDMPLYAPSPASGRSGKTLLGQLMRVYVVTPPEPTIEITLNPQVVPGPPPTPTFTTGLPDIPLTSDSFWVLRLPYVYVSDLGPHYVPKDSDALQLCKLLKGVVKLNGK